MSRELRESKNVNYKQLHCVGMSSPNVTEDVFSLEKEMTPVKSRRLQKVEEIESEVDSNDSGESSEEDEELQRLKKELAKVKRKKKEQKSQEKKEKIRKEIEKEKKELKKKTEKQKGTAKIDDSLNINSLRKCPSIKKKAESAVKKILEIDSDDSSDESGDTTSSCESDELSDSIKKSKRHKNKSKKKSGIFDHPSDEVVKKQLWPQSKLQFEYAGSKINFDDLEFNLFVAGELEILSSSKIGDVERIGRTKLLKKIAYYTELYEWKGLKKMYAHIIRQIENGLADWSKDFSEIETPILIKYVKSDVKSKKSIQYGENKKPVKKEETVFYCSHFQRKKCVHKDSHYGKIRGVDKYLQHICATCWREDNRKAYHPESSEICPHQTK